MDSQKFAQIQAAQARSGLSALKFCRRRHIAYATFLYWRKKVSRLAAQYPTLPQATFVEAIPAPLKPLALSCSDEIRLTFGAATFHLPTPRTEESWRVLFSAAKESFAC